jgi:peroxiredoxin
MEDIMKNYMKAILLSVLIVVFVTGSIMASSSKSSSSESKKESGSHAKNEMGSDAKHKMGVELGDKFPKGDVQMKNTDGKMLSISEVARGNKGTLVVFSCNHCPYVVLWEDRIKEIGNMYQEKGIGVIVINSNDPATFPGDDFKSMQARAKEKGFKFPYVVDATSEVAQAFGAKKTPEVYLFNDKNKLVYHGAIDDNSKDAKMVDNHYLKDALNAVLAGVDVNVAGSKAIGCTIKFRSDS